MTETAPPPNFAAYAPANAGQPWLRAPLPPWHLWGGTETIIAPFASVATRSAGKQLAKVSYRRPESWHWFFAAKLIDGPTAVANSVSIGFDVILGVGRASVLIPAFVFLQFDWAGAAVPRGATKFVTQAVGSDPVGGTGTSIISEIPAQDIQLSATVTNFFGPAAATVEVSGFWAPKNHIRPDWYLDAPGEAMFAGAETEGH